MTIGLVTLNSGISSDTGISSDSAAQFASIDTLGVLSKYKYFEKLRLSLKQSKGSLPRGDGIQVFEKILRMV